MKKLQTVRGTKDILEDEYIVRLSTIATFRTLTNLYGFREIETPILENSEVFKKTLGLNSDIIKKETYTFKDRSDNEITLRPEGTASVVRFFINNKLNNPLPQKYIYDGPMFRYDRPQQGRLRQFHQLGAEIIGVNDISADLELIFMAKDFLNRAHIPDNYFKIQVNSLGDQESRKKFSKKLEEFFQDHKKELTKESLERLKKNPLRILDTKNKDEQKLIEKAPKLKHSLNSKSSEIFEKFKQECEYLKIPITINDNLVRGLDYYNHICYEFVSDKLGSQDTFLAGGRYDGLIKKMGGPDYSGCGFAAGLERILLMYKEVKIIVPGLHIIVIATKKENKIKIMKITNEIRSKIISMTNLMELIFKDNLSKGLKYASEKNASHAIILGEEEISKKLITLRDLKSKKQIKIPISKLIEELSN